MTNPHPVYRPDIDGLRAIAVLCIAIFHAFPEAIPGGFVGVDVFFVISGYLITGIVLRGLGDNAFSLAEFYARRIRRIFPALIVVLVAILGIGWFVFLADEYAALGTHTATGAAFIANIQLWREAGYFDTASELKPLLHLWSLSIEEQFYLCWPAILLLGQRLRLRAWMLVLPLAAMSFLVNMHEVDRNVVSAFFLPTGRAWELLLGAAVASFELARSQHGLHLTPLSPRMQHVGSLLGLTLIIGTITWLDSSLLFPGAWALPPTIGAALLIASGPTAIVNRWLLARQGMVAIGLISYPLYLWHWPLLSIARIMESATPSVSIRASLLAMSLLLAWLTYRLVERPLRLSRSKPVVAGLVAAMIAVAISGLIIHWNDGLAFRTRAFAERNAAFEWESLGLLTRDDCSVQLNLPPRCLHNRTPYSVAILGDSHSTNTFFALSHALRNTEIGIVRLGRAGCLPFFDLESTPEGVPETCHAVIGEHLEFVLDTPSIHTVVLSTRGPLYTEAVQPNGHHHLLHYLPEPDLHDNLTIFRRAMIATLRRLESAGKQVIFVMDWPELGFDPRSCVDNRPWRLTMHVRTPCAVALPAANSPTARYQQMVRNVLRQFPHARLWNTPEYFCDTEHCWGMKNGVMLYRDDNHLSMAGSLFLGEHFNREWLTVPPTLNQP